MSCSCCDNPICLSKPPRNLSLEFRGTEGALLTWLQPELEENHEPLEAYDLFVKSADGEDLFNVNLDPSATSYLFGDEYFLEDDVEFIIVLEALYNSCFDASTLMTTSLRRCFEKTFTAIHANLTDFTESNFVISDFENVEKNTETEYVTSCTGNVTLKLVIPCSQKLKGVLTENGVHLLTIKQGVDDCTATFDYTPSTENAVLKWEILYEPNCGYGEPIFNVCEYGDHTTTLVSDECIVLPLTFPFTLNC
jgi:hypothetical protein